MNAIDSIKTRRSIRKFEQTQISDEMLLKLVDIARYAPVAANVQPLKYAIVYRHYHKVMMDFFIPLRFSYLSLGLLLTLVMFKNLPLN